MHRYCNFELPKDGLQDPCNIAQPVLFPRRHTDAFDNVYTVHPMQMAPFNRHVCWMYTHCQKRQVSIP